MPLPITTVLLVAALGCAVLGLAASFFVLVCVALLIEVGLFVVGGFGGLGS